MRVETLQDSNKIANNNKHNSHNHNNYKYNYYNKKN